MAKKPGKNRSVYTQTFKLQVLAEADASGDVPGTAKRHNLPSREYVYKWRRELKAKGVYPQKGSTTTADAPALIRRSKSLNEASQHRGMPKAAATDDEVERLLRAVGQQAIEIMELKDKLRGRG